MSHCIQHTVFTPIFAGNTIPLHYDLQNPSLTIDAALGHHGTAPLASAHTIPPPRPLPPPAPPPRADPPWNGYPEKMGLMLEMAREPETAIACLSCCSSVSLSMSPSQPLVGPLCHRARVPPGGRADLAAAAPPRPVRSLCWRPLDADWPAGREGAVPRADLMTVENDRKIQGMNDFRVMWLFYIPVSAIEGRMLRHPAILLVRAAVRAGVWRRWKYDISM